MTSLVQTSTGPIAYDERGGRAATPAPTGAAATPPIVLLPSGAHDRHDYDELRDLLPEGIRTIALDWPCHGDSPPGSGELTAMRCADVAEEAVAALAPEGAIVVGNSVGGFSAARMAIRRPELVRGLVILDGGGFGGRSPLVRAFCALMSRPRFLRAIYPAFSARYMRARTAADARAREVSIATTRSDPGLAAIAQLWRSFASPQHDLRGSAGAIGAPTLLLWGRRDPVIPLRLGRRVEGLIEGSRLVALDTGHVPHTSDPRAVASELEAFAQGIASSSIGRTAA